MVVKRVNMGQIADAAGLPRAAVWRILNNKTQGKWKSSLERVTRVQRIAEEMGYRRNVSARTMARGRFDAVGIVRGVMGGRTNDFDGLLLKGVEEGLVDAGVHRLLLASIEDRCIKDAAALPGVLREWCVDGLLVNWNDRLHQAMIAFLESHELPLIWLNARLQRDCVHPDDRQALFDATRHLQRLGHTRIAYVTVTGGHYSVADRLNGYRSAMSEAGLQPLVIEGGHPHSSFCRGLIAEQLRSVDRPTALTGYAAEHVGVAYLLAMQLGLSVPDDLSLLIVHHSATNIMAIPFSTMMIPAQQMGRAGIRILARKIASSQEPQPPESVAFEFVEGSTTAPRP